MTAQATVLYGPGIYDEVTENLEQIRARMTGPGITGYVTLTRAEDGREILVNTRTALVFRAVKADR